MKSYLLVGVQFALIGFLVWYGGVVGGLFSNALVGAGILLGLWAVATMRFRFNVLPEVRTGQKLFTGGPYAFLRHPMYTAVLLATLGLVLNRSDAVAFLAWLLLAVDLRIKLGYEERLLSVRFPEYAGYAARTRRLIPGMY